MKTIKPRNLKFTLCAFGLALPLALTSCGNSENKEDIRVLKQQEANELDYERKKVIIEQESKSVEEAFQSNDYNQVIETLDSITGLTYDTLYFSEKIESVRINGRISEQDFVKALNCLNDCEGINVLDIDGVDLFSWSSETQQLFVDTINSMKELIVLKLCSMNLSDISFLSDAKFKESLKLLALQDNNIANVEPISDYVALENLFLDENNIEDVTPLGSLDQLESLHISNNNISDISVFLDNCPRLKNIDLRYNCISDFSAGEKLESFGVDVYGLFKSLQGSNKTYSRNNIIIIF